jgi:hypothetical protein
MRSDEIFHRITIIMTDVYFGIVIHFRVHFHPRQKLFHTHSLSSSKKKESETKNLETRPFTDRKLLSQNDRLEQSYHKNPSNINQNCECHTIQSSLSVWKVCKVIPTPICDLTVMSRLRRKVNPIINSKLFINPTNIAHKISDIVKYQSSFHIQTERERESPITHISLFGKRSWI